MKLKSNFKRKLKVFAAIGVVAFILISGLAIWAGLSVISYTSTKINQLTQSPKTQQQMESAKEKVSLLTSIEVLNCWVKAQSLMALEPWLARPALNNLNNLKAACLKERPTTCDGHDCAQMKKIIYTAEGTTI